MCNPYACLFRSLSSRKATSSLTTVTFGTNLDTTGKAYITPSMRSCLNLVRQFAPQAVPEKIQNKKMDLWEALRPRSSTLIRSLDHQHESPPRVIPKNKEFTWHSTISGSPSSHMVSKKRSPSFKQGLRLPSKRMKRSELEEEEGKGGEGKRVKIKPEQPKDKISILAPWQPSDEDELLCKDEFKPDILRGRVQESDSEESSPSEAEREGNDESKDSSDHEKEGEYEVEKVLGKRIGPNKTTYLIKWKGFDDIYNSWEVSQDRIFAFHYLDFEITSPPFFRIVMIFIAMI